MLQQTSDHSFYDSQENQPIACILYRTLGNFSRPAQVSTALFSVKGKRHPGFIKAFTQRSVNEPPLLQDRYIRVVEEAGRDFFWGGTSRTQVFLPQIMLQDWTKAIKRLATVG